MPRITQLENEPKNNGKNTKKVTPATTERAKNTPTPKTVVDRKTVQPKTTVTKPTATQQKPNANVNTSNLAGVDYNQNKAQPQRNFISEPPKSFSDAINGLTNTTPMPQGKTFVPETNLQTAPDTALKLKQNQDVLSSMADESTEKANKVVNDISNAGKTFLAYLDTPDAHQKMINDFKEAKNQEKLAQVQKENEETIKSLTQEDYKNLLDENGGIKDFSQTIKDIENEISSLENTASIGNNTSLNMSEDMLANMSTHREALEKELAYYKDLDKKAKAVEESYIQDYLAQSGDTEALASYQEQLSHKNDSLLERAGTATEHLLNTTANIIPTTFDQMRGIGTANYANDNIAKLDEMHLNGEIGDAEYVEALDEWKDYIDKYRATNDDNLSQQIRRYTDQLSANTYYGASDIEKFCLQAGESTAQFLLHYAIGYVVSGAVMGSEALAGIGREALEEGAKATAEQLINAGMQNAGGSIATVSMSLASATEKTNQLLMSGVDPQTATMNGFMTGLVSYMTEKIGMDRFVDMLGTPVSVDTLGTILLKHAKNGVSEGLEEVAEGLVDPIIDSVTLGTPYEVNGEELFMEFLLGGASGLAMSLGGGAIGAVNTVADNISGINSVLNENRAVRQYVQGRIGELVINTRLQRNMVADQINTLKYNMNTMTPQQVEVAKECIARGESAMAKYDESSTALGVTFSSDIPVYPSTEESKNAFFETYAYDFNQEKQFEAKMNDTDRMINDLLGEQFKADLLTAQTQEILDKAGYKIDAKVFNSLNQNQQNRALVALDFADLLGMKVNIVNNLKAGDSGFVNKDGVITIDGTKRSILYTLTHELTHGTESSKYYPRLKRLAESSFRREGKAWDDVVNQKIEDYAKNGHELSFPEAEQEVVARFVEDKLGDEKFLDNLIKYHTSSASRLFQNLKSLGSFSEVSKVRNAFEKAFADNYRQGNDIDGMEYVINNAEPSLQDEVFISDMNESAYKYSNDSWAREDKDAIANDLANKLAVEKKVAKKWVNDVNSVAKQIADDRQRLDYEPNRFYSSMKSNDDYVVSMDMSTLCAKRIYLQATIDEIQRRLPNTILTAEDYVNIREAMKEKGYIVSCGFCYVESRRKFLDKVAQEFLDKNNYENLTLADLTTIDGIKNLQDNRPDVYEAFLKHNRARGQAKINLVEERTDYRGEIADKKKLTDAMVEKIIRIGGLRLQSFSDFETPHLIDMMQMVIDMARRGLTAQAYTKVPNFADAMGKTGIKINLSLVCKGLDSKGRLIFDDVEGMPHDIAFKLRKKYSKNVGTILVGKDDATILSAMADPRIDYIIPFHNSGWAGAEYEALGIKGYENYEKEQHEKWIDPQKHLNKNGNVSAVNEFYPADYWNYDLSGKENAEIYLQMCREDGRIPKFHRFLDHHIAEKTDENGNKVKEEWWTLKKDGSTDGYWKTLIDFKMYDNEGKGAKQEAVRPIFDNRVNNRILREYTGEHRNVKPAEDVVEDYTEKLGGVRYSSSDADYIDAINRGNIGEVRNMLRRKAKESGYSTEVFHGTPSGGFTEFIEGANGYGYAGWVSTDAGYSELYADGDIDDNSVYRGYLKDGNYLKIGEINGDVKDYGTGKYTEDMERISKAVGMSPDELYDLVRKERWFDDDNAIFNITRTKTYADLVRELGYDGVEAKEGGITTYGMLDSSLFKRAGWYHGEDSFGNELTMDDIVERDDNGEIIPLSERFNSGKKDIRYSSDVSPEQIEDNILSITDDQVPIKTVKLDSKTLDKNKIAQVLRDMPEVKTEKGKWKRLQQIMEHEFLDHLDRIVELSKEYKNPQIEALADFAMMAQSRANEAVTDKRREFVIDKKKSKAVETGESLNDIIGELSRDQIQTLGDYLYNWRNVDSMSVVDRLGKEYNGVKMKNKTVFGKDVSADESRERIAEIEAENPWVKDKAERLWEFSRQNLKLLLDAGIVSKETYDYYQKATPHYIPIQRNVEGGLGVQQLDPNKADLKFKGSSEDILPLDHNLITHTQRVYNTIAKNALHNEIMNTVGKLEEMTPDELDDVFEVNFNPLSIDEKGAKRMFAYKDGKKYSMPVDDRLYNSLAPLQKRGIEFKTLQNINNFRRNLITGWNPMFMFTNYLKDYQDAWFNTKHPFMYPINRMEAVWQIARKGELYKLYKSAGGGMNSYVDEFGKSKELKAGKNGVYSILDNISDKTLKKAWNGLLSANEFVETIPRLAEFIASIKDGNTLEQAMLDASEVTTNFKRGGDTAKYLNRNGMAFFNASLQGYRRQLRNIQDAKDGGVKGMLTYMAKLALTQAIPLYLINHLMWKDDKDYEELSDYVKQNYYIIKKYGDGKFIRIPKGRISAFYQTVMENAVDTLQGKVKLWDGLMDDLTSFMDNVAPNNPVENFILKPLWDAKNNKTWYGGTLVPSRLQDVPDSEQYDETTDLLSKEIGKLSKKVADATGAKFLELSPYKINYVLDQYTGALGDIALPAMTPATTQATKVPFANAFLDKFTTDSVLKNQNVTDLYALRDEVTKKANSLNASDEEQLASKYLYSVSSEMGELYGKKREIQADTSLSTKEKHEKIREVQKQINELAKTGLANYDQIDITGDYATVGGVQYYKTDEGKWKKPSKAQLKNSANLSDEDKDGYFQTFGEISDIREKIKAETPEGQKANYTDATVEAIRNSNMSASGKNALLDSYYNSKTNQHINDMGWSDEKKFDVKVAVQKAEGQKDENGKTISNSKAEVVAEIYRQQGVLDDVLQYIKDNNIEPSEMGLSKTVYKNLTGSSSKKKSSSSSKKKTSSKSSKTSSGGKSIKASGGSSIKKVNLVSNPMKETKPNLKRYFNAYQSVFGNGSKKVSTGGSQTVTCPNCGNSVSSSTGRCPICGANL